MQEGGTHYSSASCDGHHAILCSEVQPPPPFGPDNPATFENVEYLDGPMSAASTRSRTSSSQSLPNDADRTSFAIASESSQSPTSGDVMDSPSPCEPDGDLYCGGLGDSMQEGGTHYSSASCDGHHANLWSGVQPPPPFGPDDPVTFGVAAHMDWLMSTAFNTDIAPILSEVGVPASTSYNLDPSDKAHGPAMDTACATPRNMRYALVA